MIKFVSTNELQLQLKEVKCIDIHEVNLSIFLPRLMTNLSSDLRQEFHDIYQNNKFNVDMNARRLK